MQKHPQGVMVMTDAFTQVPGSPLQELMLQASPVEGTLWDLT